MCQILNKILKKLDIFKLKLINCKFELAEAQYPFELSTIYSYNLTSNFPCSHNQHTDYSYAVHLLHQTISSNHLIKFSSSYSNMYPRFLSLTVFAVLAASTSAQSISIALYRSNTTCLSNAQADISYTSSPGNGCQRAKLFPDGEYKAPGAFSAKVVSTSPGVVLRLFDDTACSDSTPDEVNGDGSSGCAAEASSGAGWMSFRVDSV